MTLIGTDPDSDAAPEEVSAGGAHQIFDFACTTGRIVGGVAAMDLWVIAQGRRDSV